MPVKLVDRESFERHFNVSRETGELLSAYVELLQKWNPSINLISRSTIDDIWHRHIADSAQLFFLLDGEKPKRWLDIGSGGGLPGIVVSVLAQGGGDPTKVMLVESDTRKCAFLRTVIRSLKLSVDVIEDRIESLENMRADVISARAFANLKDLLSISSAHMSTDTVCLFLKGQSYNAELTEARESWNIDLESFPSMTDSAARVLKIKGISLANAH